MSLIRKSTELNIPTNVKMMIYGQAGMGKSTVALSAQSLCCWILTMVLSV